MSRHDGIDLLKLYAKGTTKEWNRFLTDCLEKRDVSRLTKTMRELQIGMDNVVKSKLNTHEMSVWYCRLLGSLETTIKNIVKKLEPNPLDVGLASSISVENKIKMKEKKKERADRLETFLRKVSF